MAKTYNLFISHSWARNSHYQKLIQLLDEAKLDYKNYSVPENDPIHNATNDALLKEAIRAQIKPASAVLIFTEVYSSYSKWINIEIDLAKEYGKPIIAINLHGNIPGVSQNASKIVTDSATVEVNWSTSSIVKAIEKYVQ